MVRPTISPRGKRRGAGVRHSLLALCLIPLASLLLAGCEHCRCCSCLRNSFKPQEQLAEMPHGPVGQVVATWENKVIYLPDFVHQGSPTPGLAGRLWLLGPDGGHPVLGDGTVTVEIYDERQVAAGGQPSLIGQWNLSNKALRSGLSKDTFGWAYNLFLPLTPEQIAVSSVAVRVAYVPPQGPPMYASGTPLNLAPERGPLAMNRPGQPPSSAPQAPPQLPQPQQPQMPTPVPQSQPLPQFQPPPPTPLPSPQPSPTAQLPLQQSVPVPQLSQVSPVMPTNSMAQLPQLPQLPPPQSVPAQVATLPPALPALPPPAPPVPAGTLQPVVFPVQANQSAPATVSGVQQAVFHEVTVNGRPIQMQSLTGGPALPPQLPLPAQGQVSAQPQNFQQPQAIAQPVRSPAPATAHPGQLPVGIQSAPLLPPQVQSTAVPGPQMMLPAVQPPPTNSAVLAMPR